MKTIKKRAVDAFPFRIYAPAGCMELLEEKKKLRLGYVRGATEQKAIDIEKACEWLMNYFKNGDFIQHYSVDNFIKNFRKAMEGGEV